MLANAKADVKQQRIIEIVVLERCPSTELLDAYFLQLLLTTDCVRFTSSGERCLAGLSKF